MKKGKNFFYRINPEAVLSELTVLDHSEWLQFFLNFFHDLRNDDPSSTRSIIASSIIQEAHNFRSKRSLAGKASAEQRATNEQHKSTNVEHMFKDVEHCSTSSSSSSSNSKKEKELAIKPRKAPSGDHRFFIDWWCYAFEIVTGSKYPFKAKDAALVKSILVDCGKLTSAISYALHLLLSEDPFYDSAGRTIGILSNQLANLKSKRIDWAPIVEEARFRKIAPEEGVNFEDWHFWENV